MATQNNHNETSKLSEIKSVPSVCRHKSGPSGYVQRAEWLERMSKRYRQEQCNKCGLWAIWRKK